MIDVVKEKAVSVCSLVTEIGVTVSAVPFCSLFPLGNSTHHTAAVLPSPRNGY